MLSQSSKSVMAAFLILLVASSGAISGPKYSKDSKETSTTIGIAGEKSDCTLTISAPSWRWIYCTGDTEDEPSANDSPMKLLRGVQFEVKIQWAKNYSGPTHNPVSYSGMEMIITWDYSTEVHYKRNGDDYISFIWRNCTWWDPWYSVETGKTNGVTACCDHKTEAEVYDKTDGGIERALAWKVDEVWSSDTKWVCLRLNNPTGETSSTCFTDFQQFSFPELEVRAEYVHTYDGAWWTDTSDGVAVNIGADIWPPFVGANVSYSFTLKNDNAWILQEPSTGNFGGDLFPPLDSTHKYCSWVARDKPLWCSCCGGDLYCDPVFVQFDRRDSAFLPDTPARSYSPDGWLCNK